MKKYFPVEFMLFTDGLAIGLFVMCAILGAFTDTTELIVSSLMMIIFAGLSTYFNWKECRKNRLLKENLALLTYEEFTMLKDTAAEIATEVMKDSGPCPPHAWNYKDGKHTCKKCGKPPQTT